ncbi:hypothetical protein AURDEDRAFT_168952 [Auricularia subglabra TFB-10046 SS5]|nr:hypothetical protein AURDEDRAFT_168952 [Auricularia subglabra TFB-10046 SS5]
MTPELPEGPYHVSNELFRQNVTDSEPGVPLTLHVTFMDVATTTGFYSGFTATFLAAGQGGGMGGPPLDGSMSGGAPPTGTGSSSGAAATRSLGPLSGADSPADDGRPPQQQRDGAAHVPVRRHPADAQGEATMYTIVPGWYTRRAVHIHIRVFNGSFILFFKPALLDDIAKLPPHTLNPVVYANLTTDELDGIYLYAGIGDCRSLSAPVVVLTRASFFFPFCFPAASLISTRSSLADDLVLETEQLGDDLTNGLEGHIVITINTCVCSPSSAHGTRALTLLLRWLIESDWPPMMTIPLFVLFSARGMAS